MQVDVQVSNDFFPFQNVPNGLMNFITGKSGGLDFVVDDAE